MHRFQSPDSRNREVMYFDKIDEIQLKSRGTLSLSVIGSLGSQINSQTSHIAGDIARYRRNREESREILQQRETFTSSGDTGS